MKKISLTILLIIGFHYFAFSQAGDNWVKIFGGSENDNAYSVIQTSDGGFIVCGTTRSFGGDVCDYNGIDWRLDDYWILKLTSSGIKEWSKTYGGSNIDVPKSITQTNDGGYIIAGSAASLDGDVIGNHGGSLSGDIWIVKLDGNGNKIWAKCYGGTYNESASSIQLTNDGGYIITGYSSSSDGDVSVNKGLSDVWIIKIDPDGNIEWEKSYGGSGVEHASMVQQTFDGGYIIAGFSKSHDFDLTDNHGLYDFWVIKTDNTGNIIWKKSYGGSKEDQATDIKQTQDGGYILAGYTYSNDGNVDNRHYDSIPSYYDSGEISGWTKTNDFWIVKIDTVGNIEWQKSYGGSNIDFANSIWPCTDGGYLITGFSNSSNGDVLFPIEFGGIWVIKISSTGEILYQNRIGTSPQATAYSIQQITDEECIIAGYSGSENYKNDFLVAKLNNKLTITPSDGILVYPNPAGNYVNILVNDYAFTELYDMYGNKLLLTYDSIVYLQNYARGIYIIKTHDKKGGIFIQKIIHI